MALATGTLGLRRKGQVAWAKPTDHGADVVLRRSSTFDMDKTIFRSLGGPAWIITRDKLSVEVYWSEEAAARIGEAFSLVPPSIPHDQALLEFMGKDCNFAMEHADGSFMDHLQFCYEYSAAHFKGHSPRVMLLHSILGVGTNYFPMDVSLVPKLQLLLTDFEMQHIEAFPSLLRLIIHGRLLDELATHSSDKLAESLDGLSFHRVIDNRKLSMDGEAFWTQLNYQVVHMLDFLPIANWQDDADDTFLVNFATLHSLLVRAGKLKAHIDFNMTEAVPVAASKPSQTLGTFLNSIIPSAVKVKIARNVIAKYSAEIGHDLSYELHWKERSRM